MAPGDKELLLKDLCARLPYGVKIAFFNEDLTYHSEPKTLTGIECINNLNYSNLEDEDGNTTIVEFVKPYLFPMTSMTEEQRNEYHELVRGMFGTGVLINFEVLEEFFHKNHIDYRGLIHMGFALDATYLNIY